ncbi:glycosyltransferase family 2 protein [Massilia sp. PWRC2]|uniref:glycosyltransferase family 2 protein n=1 Tax=Massilia sp. PWRC2 TaxID=2804626 RepID=UPI003CF8D763
MMNILILAANDFHDNRDSGYPLALSEVNGKTLLQHLTEQCNSILGAHLTLAVNELDCKKWHLDNVVRLLAPEANVVQIRRATSGAACTALLAISDFSSEQPLLIVNGNELLDIDFNTVINQFLRAEYDAGVVIFPSVHPRYSYVRLDEQQLVVECAEKNPISNHATVGFYWFRRGRDFVESAQQTIFKHAHVDGKYYICPTLNEMVLRQARIGVHRIDAQHFHPLKSERQFEKFDATHNALSKEQA